MMDWLVRRFPVVMLARRNLSRAKVRSLLATLGIVIGVVAVSSLGMFGLAFQQYQLQQSMDVATTANVAPGPDAQFETLSPERVTRIARTAGDADVYAIKRRGAQVGHLRNTTRAQVKGLADPGRLFDAREGHIPDSWRSGALVGAQLAEDLGVHAGDSVTVDGEHYRVRAVLEREQLYVLVSQPNDALFLPPSAFEQRGYDRVAVQEDSPSQIGPTAAALRDELNHRKERYEVRDFTAAVDRFERQMAMLKLFLLGVGGVSLLVAGVSILNVMLMSAVERRAEIGVLRAVGYHRLDVLRLMLGEAMLLGVVGAVVGSVLSVGLGMALNSVLLGDPTAFPPGAFRYVALGLVFGVGAAAVSGAYPAWKAANDRPVEALRD
ncbi:MAG: ABC transporter permease [Haloferacaceae archaeon]